MTFLDRSWRRHRARLPLATALSALAWLSAPEAKADPKLRYQIDQRGDMILIGNTVGFDCRPGIPKPVVGTVDTSSCGTNLEDSSADVWWRDDAGGSGGAVANLDVKVPDARTTAVLQLPDGAKVTYARLYWAGTYEESSPPDGKVTVERPGQPRQTLAAGVLGEDLVDLTPRLGRVELVLDDGVVAARVARPGAVGDVLGLGVLAIALVAGHVRAPRAWRARSGSTAVDDRCRRRRRPAPRPRPGARPGR